MALHYNVRNERGVIMLGGRDIDRATAEHWLKYYRDTYGPEVPFANGQGYHDAFFELVATTKTGRSWYRVTA